MTINIRITGPTPLPPSVMQAMTRQMISHRSEEFRDLLGGVLSSLRPLFGTVLIPMPYTTSGTGGLEATAANTIAPGSRVLAVRSGLFGERFAEIASYLGANVESCIFPWGRAVDPTDLRARLRSSHRYDAILLTHNESSTGVLNPLQELTAVIREESDALILVDAVSSVGATPLCMDDWGIDVIVTASQKALMCPPGLAIIAAGSRALHAAKQNSRPRYFFDFHRMQQMLDSRTTPFTPAISVVFALQAALSLIEEEGLTSVYQRHIQLAKQCRKGIREAGLECFVDDRFASPTITSVLLPGVRSASDVRRQLEERHQMFVSQGRGEWKERMLRVGHMGYVNSTDISGVLESVRKVLAE